MNQAEILNELTPIFRDVLDQPALKISAESSASNVPDWDSLAHVNLVVAIERHFRIRFGLGELQGLKNVGEMAALIELKSKK